MTKKTRFPIESFGPELFALLLRGARERVELRDTWGTLQNLRTRCSILRSRMVDEKHALYALAARASFTLLFGKRAGLDTDPEMITYKNGYRRPKDRNVPALLIIEPKDSKFRELLEKADVKIEPLPAPSVSSAGTTLPRHPTDEFIDTIFDEE